MGRRPHGSRTHQESYQLLGCRGGMVKGKEAVDRELGQQKPSLGGLAPGNKAGWRRLESLIELSLNFLTVDAKKGSIKAKDMETGVWPFGELPRNNNQDMTIVQRRNITKYFSYSTIQKEMLLTSLHLSDS